MNRQFVSKCGIFSNSFKYNTSSRHAIHSKMPSWGSEDDVAGNILKWHVDEYPQRHTCWAKYFADEGYKLKGFWKAEWGSSEGCCYRKPGGEISWPDRVAWPLDKDFLFVFQMEFYSCCPGWSAIARSQLTATYASQVQVILLLQPP